MLYDKFIASWYISDKALSVTETAEKGSKYYQIPIPCKCRQLVVMGSILQDSEKQDVFQTTLKLLEQ